MLEQVVTTIIALLIASIKFAITPIGMILAGKGIGETLIITYIGALIGSFAFFYGGKAIFSLWDRVFRRNKERKVFTKGNRRLIMIKQRFGLTGFVALVGILSIPVVAFILARFYKHDKKAIPYLLLSLAVWTFSLTFITYAFKSFLI